MKRAAFSPATLLAALAAGCSVGPDYEPPPVKAPAAWSAPQAEGLNSQAAELASWWKSFQDPLLDSLVERALLSNHDVRIAAARVREARAQRDAVFAGWFPFVNSSAAYRRSRQSENLSTFGGAPGGAASGISGGGFSPGGEEVDFWTAGFDASWEIDVFGGVRRAVEAAEADIEAAGEGHRDVLVTLLAEVARNYIELRGFQRELAVARDNIKAQSESLLLTRARFDAGLTSELDVARAEAQLSVTQSQVPALDAAIQKSIHRLGVLLGQAPVALGTELAQEAAIPPVPPEIPVGLPSDLLRRRPDVRRAERELAAATARIGVAKADLFPRFFITGSAGLEASDFASLGNYSSRAWSIGPSITWQILAAGRIRANVRVQNERQEQALQRYEKTVLTSLEDVENSLVSYAQEQARRRNLAEAVRANRRAVELASELYSKGLVDFLNVLEAQQSLYLAEDQLAQSERSVSSALVTVYKALGGGWDSPLSLEG